MGNIRIAPADQFNKRLTADRILRLNAIGLAQIASPAQCVFGVRMDTDRFYSFPGISHKGRAVISYAHGHVETPKWVDPRTLAAKSMDYHSHNDFSPGNGNLARLRERTTFRK